jgi:hypothetical protein
MQNIVKLELYSDNFSGKLCWQGALNQGPTVWLDGARPTNTCIPGEVPHILAVYYKKRLDSRINPNLLLKVIL